MNIISEEAWEIYKKEEEERLKSCKYYGKIHFLENEQGLFVVSGDKQIKITKTQEAVVLGKMMSEI